MCAIMPGYNIQLLAWSVRGRQPSMSHRGVWLVLVPVSGRPETSRGRAGGSGVGAAVLWVWLEWNSRAHVVELAP